MLASTLAEENMREGDAPSEPKYSPKADSVFMTH